MDNSKLADNQFWLLLEKVYDFVFCFEIDSGHIIRKHGFDKVCTSLDAHTNYYKLMKAYKSDYVNEVSSEEFELKTSIDYLKQHPYMQFIGLENIENNEQRWYEYIIAVDGPIGAMLINDIHDKYCKNLELEFASARDYLTNLLNRRTFDDTMDNLIANKKPFSFLFIDLDDFKFINDNHGHNMGDVVLKEVAQMLIRFLPPDSIISRYGGDEFCACTTSITDKLSLENLLEQLSIAINQVMILGIHISISTGAAIYPVDGNTRKFIMHVADEALYQAKSEGKNGFQIKNN